VLLLPGGRFSGQKAQKGWEKKMVGRKIFMAEFGPNLGKKGPDFF